jgi:hypothetical protein
VDLIVVDGAKRDSEFIADLEAEPSRLRVAQVMCVGGRAPADEARFGGNKAEMLF